MRHYRAFVDAGGCYQSVRDEVRQIQRGLEAMRASLPELRAGCQRFAGRAEEISRARALNRRTLAAQGTLLDLLETPTLQETCLRHGNYDEALDLEAHVEKLAALHAADVPVVAELAEGSKRSSRVMLRQLLTRLRGAIQLPECLRVVGYLRRMSALDEVGLGRTFLRCREGHVADAVADLDDGNAYDYLKRLTDLHRVHLFDVVMQYRAIFGDADGDDEDDEGSSEGTTHARVPRAPVRLERAQGRRVPRVGGEDAAANRRGRRARVRDGALRVLRRLVGSRRAGLSADASAPVRGRREGYLHARDGRRGGGVRADGGDAQVGDGAFVRGGEGQRRGERDVSGGDGDNIEAASAPPYALLEHVPVAALTNAILAALNDLRHCALPQLRQPLADELRACVERCAHALMRVEARRFGRGEGRPAMRTQTPERSTAFTGACKALAEVAAPYLEGCYGRVFRGWREAGGRSGRGGGAEEFHRLSRASGFG